MNHLDDRLKEKKNGSLMRERFEDHFKENFLLPFETYIFDRDIYST